MSITKIDGILLKNMIIAGSNNLEKNREVLNSLNVFPVPDGDTGNNMSLTVLSAGKEVAKSNNPNVYDVAKQASSGALRGARGNSGVIVSQLFRGLAKGMEGSSVADAKVVVNALILSTQTAYKAVMKPKEGTILTVARAVSEKAEEMVSKTDDIELILQECIKAGYVMLNKTTEMLPQLKQANVVDSGGKGLMSILDGAFEALVSKKSYEILDVSEKNMADANVMGEFDTNDIKFAYCTEFFIKTKDTSEKTEQKIKDYLEKKGDSIVVVADDDIIKIHVHTNNPGLVLETAITYGELTSIKIENMKEQHSTLINFSKEANDATEPTQEEAVETERTELGFVSIVAGDGLKEMFETLGANYVISGGQTMNPSTEDILNAIDKVNSDNVIILPNNKNIILAAEQAAALSKDKKVFVVPTTSVPQGVSAIVNYIPNVSVDETLENMNEAIKLVKTGQITFAVRDTVIDDKKIVEGDILCMFENKINNVSKNTVDGLKELLESMVDDETSFISIYYGEDVESSEIDDINKYIEETYEDIEVAIDYGGQPLYYYIISVE